MSILLLMLLFLFLSSLSYMVLTLYVIIVSNDIKISCNKNNPRYLLEIAIDEYRGYKNILFMIFPTKRYRSTITFSEFITKFCILDSYKA